MSSNKEDTGNRIAELEQELALLKEQLVARSSELKKSIEYQAATAQVLEIISRSPNETETVSKAICDNAAKVFDAPFCHVFQFDGSLIHFIASQGLTADAIEAMRQAWPLPPDRGSAAGRAVLSQRTEEIPNFSADPDYQHSELASSVGYRSVVAVPILKNEQPLGVIVAGSRTPGNFPLHQIMLLKIFSDQAAIAIENVHQFQALQARTKEVQTLNDRLEARVEEQVAEIERIGQLKRFLPSAVADAVVSRGAEELLSSHRSLLGVLFCDIRGFTAFCETAEPEETIEVLQTYHEEMGKLIADHAAGVDHRMGDGIMVLFNDPLPCEDPARSAVGLAIAMRAKMREICHKWKRHGYRLGFGVGISLGYATVGMVGYEGRYDYTASGTAVNLAARICDSAEDDEILLSPRAYTAIEEDFSAELQGEMNLKGIREPVPVYRLLDIANETHNN